MPFREDERLAALLSYRILDTGPDAAFDEIVAEAAELFDAPMALISLVAADRQWFKARRGVDRDSTPRSESFCARALELDPQSIMVVEDATADPRFAENPLVLGDPNVRFYAGALLSTAEGHNLGTLCVIDSTPRATPLQPKIEELRRLAARVVDRLERHRAERRLAEQQRLLAMAEAMSSVGHWRVEVATRRIEWSDEVYRIYGLTRDAFDPNLDSLFEVLDPTGSQDTRGHFERAVRERSSYEYERRMRRPDGKEIEVLVRGACELDEHGAVVAIFGVIQDITERKRAFRRIESSQALYKLLADNMADVVTRIRLDGSSSYISPAVKTLLGYEPAEMAGRPAQDFVYPPDRPLVLATFAELAGGKDEATVHLRAEHRDGHPVWVETRFCLIRDAQGSPDEMVAVIRDISDRKALEEKLKAARAAAEAANRAKSEFLANMSHELRTPLNGVIGFSRLLAESADLNEADRRKVLLVRSAGEALNALINDVLDFSKLEAHAVELEHRPFSPGDLVSEALSMVEPQAAEKGLVMEIAGAEPGVLVGDKYRLRQVLLNFLSNAVKFTQSGRVLVRLAGRPGDGDQVALRIEVVDEGVGVPADKLGRLFQRFSQADGSVSRTFGGTGLGLAISRELVELMGGRIGAESEVGRGSTFWFEVVLPRGTAATRRERAERGRAQFPGKRVLVVDDVSLNRELFQEMLAKHGCQVTLAGDGAEAVAAAAAVAFDLVLMDVHMPVMDGLAATTAMRTQGFMGPIYALTASGSPEQLETCRAAGMDDRLLKPLSPEDLEHALIQVFEGPSAPAVAPARLPAEDVPDDEAPNRDAFERSMGPEATARLLGMFSDVLNQPWPEDAPEQLRAAAHKLAGSAGMLGFGRLSEAARRLEDACLDGEDPAALLAEVQALGHSARATIETWAARLAPATA